ncbi:MAG: lysylphosphatidylglycerol synthase transmembrane domain-containing protein [Rhodospirillaceae bacterium]
MNRISLLYFLLGLVLLGWLLTEADLAAAWANILSVGGWGLAAVSGIYLVAFYVDSLSWHLAIRDLPLTLRWSYLVWRIRMVGEAFNMVVPAGGFGGEPVKAVLLNRHHAVGYREATVSIILARTVNLIGLVMFLVIGLVIMSIHDRVPENVGWLASGGFTFLTFGVGVLFAVQHFKGFSKTGSSLAGMRIGAAVGRVLVHIQDVEDRLGEFYARRPGRFVPALGLAFLNWMIGAAETYVALRLLGSPVDFADAWMIEAVVQMVRAVTFFIPANLGTQDGVFVLLCGILTGAPDIGLAVAGVRRVRELIFVLWGFALGSIYSMRGLIDEAKAGEGEAPPQD